MHAVVVRVRVNDVERAQQALESEVVPQVSAAPGFKAGYWTRATDDGETTGLSMVVFDSEEDARAAADRVRGMVPETVTLDSVEVREVVASA
jgi:heme-degrading monooxygenase HmoA